MSSSASGMIDPAIFIHLQSKIDEDTEVRDNLKATLQDLEKQGRQSAASLAKAHSLPSSQYSSIVAETEPIIAEQIKTVARLSETASKYPYYKYNSAWSRDVQNTIFYILLCGWLGGSLGQEVGQQGRLLRLEDVGQVLKVPVNLKEEDSFHLTIEEYLHSLITLVEELSRLAINSVTQGDFQIAVQISSFVKEIFAGFQILNLKNDSLRRRSDSIKYHVKKCEDTIYDLSLRGLISSKTA